MKVNEAFWDNENGKGDYLFSDPQLADDVAAAFNGEVFHGEVIENESELPSEIRQGLAKFLEERASRLLGEAVHCANQFEAALKLVTPEQREELLRVFQLPAADPPNGVMLDAHSDA